jgi:hypothetical protein
MLFAQCLKLGRAGIPSLAHDEHALLAAIQDPDDVVAPVCCKGSAPFSTFAPLKRRGLGLEVVRSWGGVLVDLTGIEPVTSSMP